VELKDFERKLLSSLKRLPIEELARRGEDTMRYGPLKPVGLFDARKGDFRAPEVKHVPTRWCSCGKKIRQVNCGIWWASRRIYAGVSRSGYFNSWFEDAVCAIGVMHRNTFINAPSCYTPAIKAPPYCASSWAVDWYGELYGSIWWWLASWNKCSALLGKSR